MNIERGQHCKARSSRCNVNATDVSDLAITVPSPVATPSVIDRAVADCKTHRDYQHEPCTSSKGDADASERCREANDKEHLSVHVSPSALCFALQWQARCVFKLAMSSHQKLG